MNLCKMKWVNLDGLFIFLIIYNTQSTWQISFDNTLAEFLNSTK